MSMSAIDPSNALAFTQGSSFGDAQTTFGSGFRGRSLLNGDRFQELDYRSKFFTCQQHDSKPFDFEGRVSNPRSTMPLLGAEKAAWYVPLAMRRPSAPYRIGKIIVDSFTTILFGDGRFPDVRVLGDDKTQDYAQTLARVGRLPQKMIQARNLGGSTGTVGISWCFYEGKPRFEVHDAKNLHVHEWEDRVALIPRHVSEIYLFYRVMWDGKGFNKVYFWYRRDWTPDWDIVFEESPFEPGKDPFWVPDAEKSVNHADGRAHFEWVQNVPTDEEDGLPDYDGLYDQMNTLDVLCSVVSRGATLNLDPTLVINADPDLINRVGIKKGSDNALIVEKDGGDAKYLELQGTSIEVGIKLIDLKRKSILEAAQCVVADPDAIVAQGVSSLAMKLMFAPMLARGDQLREQYGAPIERMLEMMTVVARAKTKTTVMLVAPDGAETEGQLVIDLPPKVEMARPTDPDTGLPATDPMTGEPMPEQAEKTPRDPGEGGEFDLRWPAWFPPTPDDQTKTITNLQMATGGKAFLSKDTATELAADAFNLDPGEEKRRLETQGTKDKADQAAMFPSTGGEPDPDGDPGSSLPPGARPRNPRAPGGFPPKGPPKDPAGADDEPSE